MFSIKKKFTGLRDWVTAKLAKHKLLNMEDSFTTRYQSMVAHDLKLGVPELHAMIVDLHAIGKHCRNHNLHTYINVSATYIALINELGKAIKESGVPNEQYSFHVG